MAKKIRMTFKTERMSEDKDYQFRDEISIVDCAEQIVTMTNVAAYMIEHAEGFKSYSVEVIEGEAEE